MKLPRSRGGAKEEEMMNRWPGAFEAVGSRYAGGGWMRLKRSGGGQIKVHREMRAPMPPLFGAC